jgi:serine/threonine protein kinase/tetratricopeptide (TPR) repeat protein
MPDLKKNQILHSRFSLNEMIGEGGMGQVWLVWDLELEIQVAIKILNPQLTSKPDSINLLKNECRNTRRLVHPNIVRIFDFHRFKDLAFISMEYIDGRDLTTYRRQFEHINPAEIIKLIKPVINALGYAHDLGLVHRDVKASNILLDRQKTPRLTDFGIAGVFKSGHNALEITSGGSLFCMSPQQLGGGQPSPSDDIYALGVLLYELFTGYPPFYPDISRNKILHEIPAPISQKLDQVAVDANIPRSLENLIEQMLAKMPDERPASMQEINDRLKRIGNKQMDQTLPPDGINAVPVKDKPVLSQAEIITPVSVTPRVTRKGAPLSARNNLVKGLTLITTFVFLVAGGLWLWQYLASNPPGEPQAPQTVSEQNHAAPKKTPAMPEVLPEKAPDPAMLAAEKDQAEQKLADFMQVKQELEAKGVSQWANEAYREMMQLSEEADRFLVENDYIAAAGKYEAAAAKAQVLAGRVEPTLKQLLDEGRMALNQGNAELAQQKFNVALLIDPNNALAQQSLQRAQKLEAVMRLMKSGNRHEKDGNISFAHADYQEALQLDPESKEARKALARIKGQIKDREFQALMSEGLTALHNNNYELARVKLLKAKSFRPNSREAKDALAQVDQSIRLANIESYRQKAIAAEQAESWEQALNAYQQALKIDPNVQFAELGKQRSLKFIRIDTRINFFLKQPAALESDRQLDNAIQLIAEIEEINSKGPRLKGQFDKLTRLVDAAQTPVKIILESDNFTEVAVYKVGKLGRFASQELSLRPGTYTVVGTRDGYQDVRKKIIIKPGQGPIRIAVKCEVEI